jgi:hypothetical protein
VMDFMRPYPLHPDAPLTCHPERSEGSAVAQPAALIA